MSEDLQDQEERPKSLEELNKRIAQRIEAIIAQEIGLGSGPIRTLYLVRKSNFNYRVLLGKRGVRQVDELPSIGIFPMLPEGLPDSFALPVFTFDAEQVGSRNTTPHGVLGRYFVGADNRIYSTKNEYLFNKQGQAVKEELVQSTYETSNESFISRFLVIRGIDINELQKVDFIPKIGSRLVELQPGDYEKVEGILHQIESGEFEPFVQYRHDPPHRI